MMSLREVAGRVNAEFQSEETEAGRHGVIVAMAHALASGSISFDVEGHVYEKCRVGVILNVPQLETMGVFRF
jgi:hypothetical protein